MNQRSSLMVLATLVAVATAQDCGEITNCAACLDAGCASSKKVCMTACSMARDGDSCYVSTDYADMDSDAVCTIARDEEEIEEEEIVESAIGAPDEADADEADAADGDAADDDAPEEESDMPEELEELEEEETAFVNATGASDATEDEPEEVAAPADDEDEEEEEEEEEEEAKDDKNKEADDEDEDEDEEESTGPGLTISRAEGAEVVSAAVSVSQWVSLAVGAFAMAATAMNN